jgi:hypothetical protein
VARIKQRSYKWHHDNETYRTYHIPSPEDIRWVLNFEHPVIAVNTSLVTTLAKVDICAKRAFETISVNRIIGLGQDVVNGKLGQY